MSTDNLDRFTRQYIITALWAENDNSTPEGGEPFDQNFDISDIDEESLARMVDDCREFQQQHSEHTAGYEDRAGHDFWLTRNGHGAGFWDGDWDEPAATILTDSSRKFGECSLYLGDDGKIHLM